MSKEENSMVELIVGKKGKGKTKVLLDKVNGAIKEANGSIVYLDKSTKHMYELNNKVRLIDVSVYPIIWKYEVTASWWITGRASAFQSCAYTRR